MGQECEGVSRKWGRIVRRSAESRVGVLGRQQEMRQEWEWVGRKWGSSVRGSAVSGLGV